MTDWLAQIRLLEETPLKDLVEASNYPQTEGDATTVGAHSNGVGWCINTDGTLQLGTVDANTTYLGPSVNTTAQEIMQTGHLTLAPSSSNKSVTLNGGKLNPQLIPPVDPLAKSPESALAMARQLARDTKSGGLMGAVRSAGKMLVNANAPRFTPPQLLLTTVAQNLGPSDEPVPIEEPYVELAAHEHPHMHTVVMGLTTGTTWLQNPLKPPTSPLLGVNYEFLFGHNRTYELLIANRANIIGSILEG